MNWYVKCIRQFADFNGRARRSEYWFFSLFSFLFVVLAMAIDLVAGLTIDHQFFGITYILYVLFAFVPGLAVTVRRLHDVGKSGWFYLIVLIPIIGAIWLLVLLFTDSEAGENKWGPNPKLSA